MAGFQIYSDFGDENAPIMGVGGRKAPLGGPHGRTALGALSNVTRVQPTRAAKANKLQSMDAENGDGYFKGRAVLGGLVGCSGGGFRPTAASKVIAPLSKVVPGRQQQGLAAPTAPPPFSIYEDESVVCAGPPLPPAELDSPMTVEPMALDAKQDVMEADRGTDTGRDGGTDAGREADTQADAGTDRRLLTEDRLRQVVMVPEYRREIYTNVREAELRYTARADYMRKQADLTHSMRSILVDWLVEVAEEYKLHRETLCLAVNYVDRFLSTMAVVRSKLQLVGAAAIFIAAKYEEIYPPDVGEYVYITDNTYTKKQVLQMEKLVLRALAFDVAAPTAAWFCQDALNEIGAGDVVSTLAMYLVELTLMDGEHFLKFLPSVVGTSAVWLANYTLGITGCMNVVRSVTGYGKEDLSLCTVDLFYAFHSAPKNAQQSIREKYSHPKMHEVAKITPPQFPPMDFE